MLREYTTPRHSPAPPSVQCYEIDKRIGDGVLRLRSALGVCDVLNCGLHSGSIEWCTNSAAALLEDACTDAVLYLPLQAPARAVF